MTPAAPHGAGPDPDSLFRASNLLALRASTPRGSGRILLCAGRPRGHARRRQSIRTSPSAPSLAGDPSEALGRYSEEDNAATSFLETPPPEPHWLVQVTPFDRRLWSRERVLEELLHQGGLIHRDTLVWRGGMNNWRSIAQLDELHG